MAAAPNMRINLPRPPPVPSASSASSASPASPAAAARAASPGTATAPSASASCIARPSCAGPRRTTRALANGPSPDFSTMLAMLAASCAPTPTRTSMLSCSVCRAAAASLRGPSAVIDSAPAHRAVPRRPRSIVGPLAQMLHVDGDAPRREGRLAGATPKAVHADAHAADSTAASRIRRQASPRGRALLPTDTAGAAGLDARRSARHRSRRRRGTSREKDMRLIDIESKPAAASLVVSCRPRVIPRHQRATD